MRGVVIGALILCVIIVGFGFFFSLNSTGSQTRILPMSPAYQTRLSTGGWSRGDSSAPVQMVLYTDLQSSTGQVLFSLVEQAYQQAQSYTQFTFRHYPLSTNNKAMLAAQGAEAAGRQGKFWEMVRVIYANQNDWLGVSPEAFPDKLAFYAQSLNLNKSQFLNDLNDTSITDPINHDAQLGNQIPISDAPTLVINGTVVTTDPHSVDEIVQLLEKAKTAPSSSPNE